MCLQSMRPLWIVPLGIVYFSHYPIIFLDMTCCCCVVVRLQFAAKQLLGAFFLSHHDFSLLSCLLFLCPEWIIIRVLEVLLLVAEVRHSLLARYVSSRQRMCCTSQRQSHCRDCWLVVGDYAHDDSDDVVDDGMTTTTATTMNPVPTPTTVNVTTSTTTVSTPTTVNVTTSTTIVSTTNSTSTGLWFCFQL